ncbi:hypothetical protein ACLOJK_029330 [Asimina triloba]
MAKEFQTLHVRACIALPRQEESGPKIHQTGDAGDNFNLSSDGIVNYGVHMHDPSSGTLATQSSQACRLLNPHIMITKGRVPKQYKGPLELPRSGMKIYRGCNKWVVGHDKCNCSHLKEIAPSEESDRTDVVGFVNKLSAYGLYHQHYHGCGIIFTV